MTRIAPDEPRFKGWLEAYGGILSRVVRSFARSAADADDLRQEMLLQLWASLPEFAGGCKESTWVYRVCFNTALMWRRSLARKGRAAEVPGDLSQLAGEAASPAESAGRADLLERLYTAIRSMPESERALVLLQLDGASYRDIAEVTGITENHVGVSLTRARQRLSALMKEVSHELE